MNGRRLLLHFSRQAQACLPAPWRQQSGCWRISYTGKLRFSAGANDDEGDGSTAESPGKDAAHQETGSIPDPSQAYSSPIPTTADTPVDQAENTSTKSEAAPVTTPSADVTAALDDLLPELEAADPILAAQAGFDLDLLKQAAGAGSIQPSVLQAYIELAKPTEPGDPEDRPVSDLDLQVEGAVRDQYAHFGITADDLRQYLDVSLDIEDAISAGRSPSIDPDRYEVYRRVDSLVKYGPEKSPEETARLDMMAEQEMLKMPWPTTMIRAYLKKRGVKLKRLDKKNSTTYDRGYLAEAMFPFEYEEDLEAAITGEANKGAVRSFWDDEVNEDGTIERTSGRAVGTEDLTAWGQAVWVAMQTQAKNMDAAEDRESEVVAESTGEEASRVGVSSDADGLVNAGQDAVQNAKEAVSQHGQAMQALILAKLGERVDFSEMDADAIKQVDADAAKAISEAAFEAQEESILRGVGYERSQLPQFLEEVAMTEEDWQRWVQQEVTQTVERLCTRQMDSRSPQDVFEEFLAGQRTVRPWYGVATDKRAIVESHPYGPLSDKQALPAHVTDNEALRHPVATAELMRGLVEAGKHSNVFPEIFKFTQTMWMHLGEKPYHPGNRRVKMHVHVRDLQVRYGLSVEALQHILAVVGNRYSSDTGILTLSCDRHRAREENRRQAMHWMLNLIESALIAHPSDEWETMKQTQEQQLKVLEEEAVPDYLQYITPTIPTPTISTQVS